MYMVRLIFRKSSVTNPFAPSSILLHTFVIESVGASGVQVFMVSPQQKHSLWIANLIAEEQNGQLQALKLTKVIQDSRLAE